jgi:16S rRNA (cytosine967-C5)-methyltransferase
MVTVATEASAARRCAFAVVRRVFERGAYADRALHAEARVLDGRDRSLAMRLAYGTIQRRATLDHLVVALSGRPVEELDPAVLAALRLGLYQLHFADGIADHAAVNESVTLARSAGAARGAGLVNAVLRRSTREGAALLEALDDRSPQDAAVMHSLPVWLAERWFAELGPDEARALMRTVNEPAESALRVNTLLAGAEELGGRLPVAAHRDPVLADALVLDGPFDAHGSQAWREGAFMPQSRASMLVALAVDPSPGERVLDLCAAPGAKTTHLAALMQGSGSIVAVERHRGRAEALERTCLRMHAGNVTVEVSDARSPRAGGGTFDRVLVDPPCSGLGTLQSRPDLRWRASPESIERLVAEQAQIMDVAAAAVAPGGRLVYSTCTLSARENEAQVDDFLGRHPDFGLAPARSDLHAWEHPSVQGLLLALPHRHRTDGFFIARLDRRNTGPAEG